MAQQNVGPNLPVARKGKGVIMYQGQTAGLYGLDPTEKSPVPNVGDEPVELKP